MSTTVFAGEPRKHFDRDLEIINNFNARLGSGTFGSVYKGVYKIKNSPEVAVAIKTFNSRSL